MTWTKAQQRAIDLRDKNILVSAAAGSGKTAVLVERILKLIIDERVGVDELLVVTFTKAAAAEMKAKIVKAIRQRIKEDPSSADFLRAQLKNMYKTSICTFHAFAINIIKRYFFVIDLDSSLRPADETQTKLIETEVLDELFDEKFAEKDERFVKFLTAYSDTASEDAIKAEILNLYNKMMNIPEPFKWLSGRIEDVKKCVGDDGSKIRKTLADILLSEISKAIEIKEKMIEQFASINSQKQMAAHGENLSELLDIKNDINEGNIATALGKLQGIKPASLGKGDANKEDYEALKTDFEEKNKSFKYILSDLLQKEFCAEPLEMQLESLAATYPYLKTLEELLVLFHEKYTKAKSDKGIMNFNDMEHFAMEILKNEAVAEECQRKFKYIFIDEYQDSNFIQEEIINRIKRENNLFMVGDIKQSIYSFRNAEPSIFREKYKSFAEEKSTNDEKIDLNMNFRSKKTVLGATNAIFENIMEGYDENAALYEGIEAEEKYIFETELLLIDRSDLKELKEMTEGQKTLKALSRAELEGLLIAKKIKELVGSKIYDNKAGCERELSYRDIVILFRNLKGKGEALAKILEQNGIPTFMGSSSGYFDTLEVRLVKDLLMTIDNINRDIPLLAVLNSVIFDFKIDELIKIRISDKEATFSEAFLNYREIGDDEELKAKCEKTLERLFTWKQLARYIKIDEFVWQIINESGIYNYISSLPNGEQRQLNLRTLIEKTLSYAKGGDNSIFGLIRYFDNLKEKVEVGTKSLLSEEADTVQITTIHKSKGLEYPVVIVPQLAQAMSGKANQHSLFDMDVELGVAVENIDIEQKIRRKTLLQSEIAYRKQRERLEEELRILYVAMTRAKERLIMIGTSDDVQKLAESISFINPQTTYLQAIYPHTKNQFTKRLAIGALSLEEFLPQETQGSITKDQLEKILLDMITAAKSENAESADIKNNEIRRILDYKYPYAGDFEIKSKYGVTELATKGKNIKPVAKIHFASQEESMLTAIEIGTAYHTAMEHIDFKKALEGGKESIEEQLLMLRIKEILTAKELESIDKAKLSAFFESDIGKRATLAKDLKKEESFIMSHDVNGTKTLVQGVIDCYFEEPDGLVIVDYKTNKSDSGAKEKYAGQIQLYKEALEKATGKNVKEAWLYMFELKKSLQIC